MIVDTWATPRSAFPGGRPVESQFCPRRRRSVSCSMLAMATPSMPSATFSAAFTSWWPNPWAYANAPDHPVVGGA